MAMLTVALKTVFILLACSMTVALVYAFTSDFFASCFDPKARWMQVGLLDFCIDISFIGAWFFYKESRWIMRVCFLFVLFWLGSWTTCVYIILQLFKLTPKESSKDPIYFVLVRRQKRDAFDNTWRVSVVTTRTIYILLGCLMLGSLVFAFATDGSPFRAEVFSPCILPLLHDFLIMRVAVFSVWVAYKESSWINVFAWILLSICFGSVTLCAYVVRELFYLSHEQPVFLILFNKSGRELVLSDPLLMENDNA